MIDLTPLDVRKKKGDFKKRVRGYDPQLVDDFLDLVAERLEELVKQNVELSERARQLQDQVASFRERERALNEALVAAQELREQARAQAQRESELVRREAEAAADRILDEGQRALRDVKRQFEALESRKASFMRGFRSLLERYLAEVDVDDTPVTQEPEDREAKERARASASSSRGEPAAASKPVP
ncbi:MAG: DivIVA domain-containing protein, partial [Gemmatimonadota bacterium]